MPLKPEIENVSDKRYIKLFVTLWNSCAVPSLRFLQNIGFKKGPDVYPGPFRWCTRLSALPGTPKIAMVDNF
jgi:hypothetical protein